MFFLHAIVGAMIGHSFGFQALGAFIAIWPQTAFLFCRSELREEWHNVTHSFYSTWVLGCLAWYVDPKLILCTVTVHLSHLLIDCIVNPHVYGPALFYPFWNRKFSFQAPFWVGLIVAILWVNTIVLLNLKRIV